MTEEPCQCSDCQRFYKEHDRLIREFPTFKQQQELNWASIQSFRTLCSKVTEHLRRKLSERESTEDINLKDIHKFDEILLIGSGKGVTPVKLIKQYKWKNKSVAGYKKINKYLKFLN